MSASSVRNLRVFESNGTEAAARELDKTVRRYRSVRSIADRSLLLLESPEGLQTLQHIGEKIVTHIRGKGEECRYPGSDNDLRDIPHHIDYFLEKMRSGFPEVHLFSVVDEAATIRYSWGDPTSNLTDFDPQEAGNLRLNSRIVEDMVHTRNSGQYNTFLFQMTIYTAHEIVHLFTGYLTGRARNASPGLSTVPGTSKDAGFVFEVRGPRDIG